LCCTIRRPTTPSTRGRSPVWPPHFFRERHGVVVHVGIGESGSGVATLAASCEPAVAIALYLACLIAD
jgi:hypothetical protein